MQSVLVENPVLLLFVVASLGYLLGSVKIRGGSLGVAAVLFTGLIFGAVDPRLDIPAIILQIGLAVFVYSVGLSSGPSFFQAYRRHGFRDFGFILAISLGTGLLAIALWALFGFSAATIAGIYTGSTTNTAALAGTIDLITNTLTETASRRPLEDVVVGYSFSYPMGVLGGMIAIVLLEKWLRIDYAQEGKQLRKEFPLDSELTELAVDITNPEIAHRSVRDLFQAYGWNVVFGRLLHDGNLSLVHYESIFTVGDVVMLVGEPDEVERVVAQLGKVSDTYIPFDRSIYDRRRIFVSNPKIAGRTIASLNLDKFYQTVITRIRRGDVDMLAKSDTVLELGDRLRFVARREDLDKLSKLFGDSYRASSTINLFSFGLGIGLGLLLGTVEFSLGPQFSFRLGFAGGPLIVGLILGSLRRTGPVLWTLPYSANITLQQLGLMMLLAAIGVRSGGAFVESLSMEGLYIFLASAIISLLTAISILWIGYRLLKMPFTLLTGMVANQPAILEFATARTGNRVPTYGFTLMFPIALISKIVIAQLLFLVLR